MTHQRLTISEVSPAYWRVTIGNPPINPYDPEMFAELRVLMDRIETSDELKVVVFDSANPDYFVAHYDLERGEIIPDVPGAGGVLGGGPRASPPPPPPPPLRVVVS